jgi:hypothetical protein
MISSSIHHVIKLIFKPLIMKCFNSFLLKKMLNRTSVGCIQRKYKNRLKADVKALSHSILLFKLY